MNELLPINRVANPGAQLRDIERKCKGRDAPRRYGRVIVAWLGGINRMIHKSFSHSPSNPRSRILVTFELPSCTWACRIFVCGDFNNWCTSSLQMRQDRDGVWRATVDLPPNQKFNFRYLIDGNWQTDYHADGWSHSGYGSENSLVDTGLLPELTPEELALLAEPADATLLDHDDTITQRLPYPSGNLVVEERVTLARRPVSQPALTFRRAE